MLYDVIPVEPSDSQPDTETQDTKNAASSLYAIHFDEGDGMVGLQNGGIEVIELGQLQTKDATRVRIRWYVLIAILRDSAIARLKGINAA